MLESQGIQIQIMTLKDLMNKKTMLQRRIELRAGRAYLMATTQVTTTPLQLWRLAANQRLCVSS
jgi:hypothetical protein